MSEVLMHLGIVLMGGSFLCGIVSFIVFSVTGKRIKRKLSEEFGEKHR